MKFYKFPVLYFLSEENNRVVIIKIMVCQWRNEGPLIAGIRFKQQLIPGDVISIGIYFKKKTIACVVDVLYTCFRINF